MCQRERERERERESEIDVWLLINRVKNVSDAPKQCYAYCIEYPDQLYIVTSILQVFHVLENDSAKLKISNYLKNIDLEVEYHMCRVCHSDT